MRDVATRGSEEDSRQAFLIAIAKVHTFANRKPVFVIPEQSEGSAGPTLRKTADSSRRLLLGMTILIDLVNRPPRFARPDNWGGCPDVSF